MISYLTKGTFDPWSDYDIRKYAAKCSQYDKVIYNARHNARFILTEENVFLCNMKKKDNIYQNFYLIALTNNSFVFTFFIPQLDTLREIEKSKVLDKCLPKLPLIQKSISSYNSACDYSEDFKIIDGAYILIKVNSSIEKFLFPLYGKITDNEILSKYELMNSLYKRAIKEFDALSKAFDKFEQMNKEKIKRLIFKIASKTIRYSLFATTGIHIPGFDHLFDLDYISLADMAANIEIEDCLDLSDNLSEI